MYYYTIEIPRHEPDKVHPEGKIAVYPPNWFGVMGKCPQNVTVKIFNDKKGWLLAQCDDTFIPKEVKVISEADALALMSKTQQAVDVFVGVQKIADRWMKLDADRLAEQKAQQNALFTQAVEKVLNG
jgi:cold shock CspA family protein